MKLFRSTLGSTGRVKVSKPSAPRARLVIESLEDRCLMSRSGLTVLPEPPIGHGHSVGEVSVAAADINSDGATTIASVTGGAGAGKIKFNEFTIKKTTDKASSTFF